MPESVRTTTETFHTDTSSLYPLQKYDCVEGTVKTILFRVQYEPPEETEYRDIYGTYTIDVFGPQENIDEKSGGTVFYSEKHTEPDTNTPLYTLFVRARKIAKEIQSSKRLHKCPYCGFMANDDWKTQKRWPIYTRRSLKRVVPMTTNIKSSESVCSGMVSWFPPKVETYKHKKQENPIFTQQELEKCDSLVIAPGYPEWAYKSQLNWHTNFRLRILVEKHPHVFKDEIDTETLTKLLDSLDLASFSEDAETTLTNSQSFTYRQE